MQSYKLKLTVHSESAPAADLTQPSQIVMPSSATINLGDPLSAEVTLHAKNTATLEEYSCRCPFQAEFLSKLEKWIAKKRFSC